MVREQQQSKLEKKGEGDEHEAGVLRLKGIAESMGYQVNKDHLIFERIHENIPLIEQDGESSQFYRLDLVLKNTNPFNMVATMKYTRYLVINPIICEIDGARHDKKTTQAKDDTKTKEVLTILRKFDPFFIRFKLYTLIGKYQWSDECLLKVLSQPQKHHLKTIC